jgi:Alginate lyase
MNNYLLRLSFAIFGAFFSLAIYAQGYAAISPEKINSLINKQGSDSAQKVLTYAKRNLSRPPGPLAKIHTEGTLPHEGIYDASVIAMQDLNIMNLFAMSYRLTGDKIYLNKATEYLEKWIDIYDPSFNPIDETKFDKLILTYDLIQSDLSPELNRKAMRFFYVMANGYIDKISKQSRIDVGNWQSHRIKLIVLSAYATNNIELIYKSKILFQGHLERNLNADGSTYDFRQRDALHYAVYDLEPLLVAAIAFKAHGENIFDYKTSQGVSLRDAVNWLKPYAEGDLTHEEFVNSPVLFDKQRAKAGIAGYQGLWERSSALLLYSLASVVDPIYKKLRDSLVKISKYEPPYLFELEFQ